MNIATQTSWQLLFEHSESPILICSLSNSSIIQSNKHCLDLLEYELSFLQKSFFSDFLVGEHPDEWAQRIIFAKTGMERKWETTILSKNHEIKSVEVKIVSINEQENLCLLILKDLKREDEKITALKTKLKFYETILMQMPTEFAVLNAKWQYLFINQNSIKDEEFRKWMIGKNDYDFCRYRNKPFTLAENRHKQYNELARTKTGKEWVDEHLLKDGSKKYVLRKLFPYFIDGELIMNFGFGIDITERINAEKEKEVFLSKMMNQNEELKQFAYIATHDLKEPLRNISGFTNLLKRRHKDLFDENALEYMKFIIDNAARMDSLLNDLKSFVTLDRIEERSNGINSKDIINAALSNLKLKIMETKAEVIFQNEMPKIRGHKQYLVQLFQNLINNAIKFCEETPKILIKAEDLKTHYLFSIKDNGIGIDPEFKEKIFRIFNRLDKQNYEGTGMGLAICKKVVQLHQGELWVESDGKNGSTFLFTIER